MKLKLDIKGRLGLGSILPQKAGLNELLLVKSINEKNNFTKDELSNLNFKAFEGKMSWNGEIKDKEIEISDIELNFLKDRIAELDKNKELSIDVVDLVMQIKDLK